MVDTVCYNMARRKYLMIVLFAMNFSTLITPLDNPFGDPTFGVELGVVCLIAMSYIFLSIGLESDDLSKRIKYGNDATTTFKGAMVLMFIDVVYTVVMSYLNTTDVMYVILLVGVALVLTIPLAVVMGMYTKHSAKTYCESKGIRTKRDMREEEDYVTNLVTEYFDSKMVDTEALDRPGEPVLSISYEPEVGHDSSPTPLWDNMREIMRHSRERMGQLEDKEITRETAIPPEKGRCMYCGYKITETDKECENCGAIL